MERPKRKDFQYKFNGRFEYNQAIDEYIDYLEKKLSKPKINDEKYSERFLDWRNKYFDYKPKTYEYRTKNKNSSKKEFTLKGLHKFYKQAMNESPYFTNQDKQIL